MIRVNISRDYKTGIYYLLISHNNQTSKGIALPEGGHVMLIFDDGTLAKTWTDDTAVYNHYSPEDKGRGFFTLIHQGSAGNSVDNEFPPNDEGRIVGLSCYEADVVHIVKDWQTAFEHGIMRGG